MILTGSEIQAQIEQNNIKIDPFDSHLINTNSYDVRLGKKYLKYSDDILDPKRAPTYQLLDIPEEGLVLNPGDFILAETNEKIGSTAYVPILHAKSSTARSGLFVHITADLIDIGSYGKLTLQLYATLKVTIYPHMRIGQVSFWVPKGAIKLYEGKYQSSDGPRPSLIFLDELQR